MNPHRDIGLDRLDGFDVGRDPRVMSSNELEQLGHARMSPLRVLRMKCLDSCNGSAQEVRLCTALDCPSWPFRMGKNRWRRKLDQEERAVLRARLAPNGASEPTVAQKTGSQIEASAFDGRRVPNDTGVDFSPTNSCSQEGGTS